MGGKYTDTHPQFTIFVNGVFSPAADGEVEFFTVGNTGAGNRKDTFSDPDLTVVNPNPMPLDSFGRSINDIFLEGTYNTIIRGRIDNILVQQDEVDNVSGSSGGAGLQTLTVQFATDLRGVETAEFKEAYVIGTSILGDGGQGHFYFNSTSTEADNGVDVIEPTVGGGRWLLLNNAHNSFVYSQAAGTVDAITVNPTPIITGLDKTRFFVVQSLGPNTIAPTFKAGTSSTLNLQRDNANPLELGDTGEAGYQMLIKANEAESLYILMNPSRVKNSQLINPFPVGFIGMWSGTLASIPTGWALCDGGSSTPDLRDRFILSVGTAENPGATGGSSNGSLSSTNSVSAGTPAGSVTVNNHVLTLSQVPQHSHLARGDSSGSGSQSAGTTGGSGNFSIETNSAGGGAAHNHGGSFSGSALGVHGHTYANNFPLYYKLAFIMFTG